LNLHLIFNRGEAYFTGAATQPEAGKPRQSLNLGVILMKIFRIHDTGYVFRIQNLFTIKFDGTIARYTMISRELRIFSPIGMNLQPAPLVGTSATLRSHMAGFPCHSNTLQTVMGKTNTR
ncbi:MAG: hypothetical protein PVG86_11090, partial [Desulfobacterales bacterium]